MIPLNFRSTNINDGKPITKPQRSTQQAQKLSDCKTDDTQTDAVRENLSSTSQAATEAKENPSSGVGQTNTQNLELSHAIRNGIVSHKTLSDAIVDKFKSDPDKFLLGKDSQKNGNLSETTLLILLENYAKFDEDQLITLTTVAHELDYEYYDKYNYDSKFASQFKHNLQCAIERRDAFADELYYEPNLNNENNQTNEWELVNSLHFSSLETSIGEFNQKLENADTPREMLRLLVVELNSLNGTETPRHVGSDYLQLRCDHIEGIKSRIGKLEANAIMTHIEVFNKQIEKEEKMGKKEKLEKLEDILLSELEITKIREDELKKEYSFLKETDDVNILISTHLRDLRRTLDDVQSEIFTGGQQRTQRVVAPITRGRGNAFS
ncbi:MAG: hypothetical protein K5905_04345 [Roseibium sp.]|uniref:hypothetical protein n=1 Tax=Roseibium sp. TaxID=1936156 RepID=UPI0026373468|nr:hypothetical protein [Roseibium sp.]MCV0424680.1 hypothetical protein [Roseibium sp.]